MLIRRGRSPARLSIHFIPGGNKKFNPEIFPGPAAIEMTMSTAAWSAWVGWSRRDDWNRLSALVKLLMAPDPEPTRFAGSSIPRLVPHNALH
jgi:hypothetical protein